MKYKNCPIRCAANCKACGDYNCNLRIKSGEENQEKKIRRRKSGEENE
jgi:hypothetical protein